MSGAVTTIVLEDFSNTPGPGYSKYWIRLMDNFTTPYPVDNIGCSKVKTMVG